MAGRVLVIDDDAAIRRLLGRYLGSLGFETIEAADCAEGLRTVRDQHESLDLVFIDYQLPDGTGLELLPQLLAVDRGLPIIMLTGFGSVALATRAAHLGAVDFAEKPINLQDLTPLVERARTSRILERRLESLAGRHGEAFRPIVTQDAGMDQVLAMAAKVAPTTAAVLLMGESGTGKELFARAIHGASARAGGPFVALNCAAIPAELLESELFGHRRGAFTGANEDRVGRFEQARGGTLFLDEIGDMAPALQAKVLRVLQERTVTPVGGDRERPVDVRIVAATHRDLRAMAAAGDFREDLWFRLAEFPIEIPALRERRGDVPLLVQRMLADAVAAGIGLGGVAPAVIELLEGWSWPGNVRELQNVVRRAAILAGGEVIGLAHLPSDLLAAARVDLQPAAAPPTAAPGTPALVPDWSGPDDIWTLGRLEEAAIRRGHEVCEGNVTQLAQRLGIGRTTLYRKLEALGLS